mgnify:CR=1 FL=1
MNFKNGDRVTCKIHVTEIKDARISIDKDGTPFICQNVKCGVYTEDKLGYEYSWRLSKDFTDCFVKDLKLVTPTWDTLSWKDIVLDSGGDRRMVLAVQNDSVLISCADSFEVTLDWNQKKELQKRGYTIEGSVEEITVAEAEARLGVKIKTD